MKVIAKHFGIIVCYALLTCLLLWPLPLHLSTALLDAESGDPLMQIWVVQWNIQKLSTALSHYFDANIFYPYTNTFAYHDHMFGLGLLGWPVHLIAHNPILTYNVLLMLSFLLSAYAMYWLAKSVCHSEYAAWIAGLLFGFLPYRFAHLDHLNLLSIQWLPVCLLFFTRVLFSRAGTLGRERIFRNLLSLAGFWLCFLLQALTSFNYLFMLVFAIGLYGLVVLLLQRVLYRRILVSARMVAFFVLGGCLVGLLLMPFVLPYLRANREMGFERTLDEARTLSAHPRNYLAAPANNALYGRMTSRFHADTSPFPREQVLFPGIIMVLLACIGLVGQSRKFTRSCRHQQLSYMILGSGNTLKNFTIIKIAFLILGVVAVILSFGPSLDIFGKHLTLPYAWLYQFVPGFKSMRVPARFGLPAAFALSMLAAIGVTYIHTFWMCRRGTRHSARYVVATLLLGAAIVVEIFSLPKSVTTYPGTIATIPPVYQWLAAQPAGTRIIELPVQSPKDDFEYTYYSTFHWKRIVNGRSAFIPDGITQVFGVMRDFPTPQALELLNSLGIDYVFVHTDKLIQPFPRQLPEGLKLFRTFDDTLVLQLPDAARQSETHWLHVTYQIPERLRPAEEYRIGVSAQSMLQEPLSPLPQERLTFHIQWQQAGEMVIDMTSAIRLPILFRNIDPITLPLVLKTPDRPGEYQLFVRTGSTLVERPSTYTATVVTLAPDVVDSRQPQRLQAEFIKIDHPNVWLAGRPLSVDILVRNTGDTIWKAHLANRQQPAGEVHLGVVAWLDAGSGSPLEGQGPLQVSRGFLPYDIAPGQEAVIRAELRTPDIAGDYRIELNLVSELIQWFPQDAVTISVVLE